MQINLENKCVSITAPLIHRFVDLDEVARTHVSLSAKPAANGSAHRHEGNVVRGII